MKLLPICLAAASAALAHAQYAGTTPIPDPYRKGVEAIQVEDAQSFLGYLAGPECEGRGTVQPGFQKAARFMADHFKQFGLKPVGDKGTYFQIVHFARTSLLPSSTIASRDGSKHYVPAGEIAFGSLNRNVDISGDTVWLKVSDPAAPLPKVEMEGRLVFVVASSFPAPLRATISAKSPSAVIYVTDSVFQPGGNALRPTSVNLSRVSIVQGAAARMAADQGLPATLFDGKDVEQGIQAFKGKGQLRILANFQETDPVDAMNVVGLLPGSDPKLAKELVGIGAHLDHLGKNGDTVYPGADDDGSGSTALLEVMKAYHEGGQKPKRSILFMAFCGEEMGLLGSGYYSDHPIFPHEQMIAELQMDMVGRDSDGIQNGDKNRVDKREENIDTMRLVGSKRISTDLDNLIESDNKYIGFKFKWDAEDVYTRSDHYNFAKHGIPIAFLFDGFHPDYHRPTDTVDKIDWVKLTNAAKLYYIVSLDLANNPERPRHDVPQTGG